MFVLRMSRAVPTGGGRAALIDELDAAHRRSCREQRDVLRLVARVDRLEAWRDDGASDATHWLSMRYGVSRWKARRWIAAGHALERLPRIDEALASGQLGLDKVVELCRFASAETESDLILWARRVSCAAVRQRGDLAVRGSIEEALDAERARFVSWWYVDEGRRVGLEAELPSAQGAIVLRAIERMAAQVPPMPDEDPGSSAPQRRADALVAICSSTIAADPDPDRATVVIHAELEGLRSGSGGCEIEGGPAIDPLTVRRLLCNARVQTVVEGRNGEVLGLGRTSREPSAWMLRQIRYRDRECRFPGCGARRFTEAHHVTWWRHGGRTDLDNLVLICSFHHRLVHELGWSMRRDPGGGSRWLRPDGTRYRAGPSSASEEPIEERIDQRIEERTLVPLAV